METGKKDAQEVIAKQIIEEQQQRLEEDGEITCAICLAEVKQYESGVVDLGCGVNHMFHGECLGMWKEKNNTCPLCRELIDESFL